MLLGGGTISGIMREWTKAGLTPPQQGKPRPRRRRLPDGQLAPLPPQQQQPVQRGWNRNSIRTILLNPRIAGGIVGLP
jgi:hypothetical protein